MPHPLRLFLLPFSLIYASAVFVRNRFFDLGVFKSQKGALPSIVIGNIAAGGTGKTPHAEYLLRYLSQSHSPGFLSRGYGRKTRGYVFAGPNSTAFSIGDEPMQIDQKFPALPIAVCEDRLEGIRRLKAESDASILVLDDAFQHRKLKADLYILLVDFNFPYWSDWPLPAGNLRDNVFEKRRADVVIFTKCPQNLPKAELEKYSLKADLTKNQLLFFTCFSYEKPIQISGKKMELNPGQKVVAFSGIAQTDQFKKHLENQYDLKDYKAFGDHHIFSQAEINNLWNECGKFAVPGMVLVTTEKDAVRLKEIAGIEDIPIFFIPIEVRFLNREDEFLRLIDKTVVQNLQ